ncbi:hypothetical protein [Vibrio sp. ER1A]|uniref:hypothetical protein n=1 Tax=Vibrio sp. ER1A TaxID=1517681 RepID=UPI000A975B27|nr:hypothetical protein [Vibrio sp. ER1A]
MALSESRKAFFRTQRLKRRKIRLSMREVHQKAIEQLHRDRTARAKSKGRSYHPSSTHIGWTAVRVKQDGSYDQLPPYLNTVFKACREFIDNPQRFKELSKWSCMRRQDTRVNVAKVLVVLLARSDLIDGKIGIPTEEGMNTLSHDEIMKEYVLRWGEMIEDSKYYTVMRHLRNAGVLSVLQLRIELPGCEEKTYRSAASYKQLSIQFFKELNVTMYENIAVMIYNNRSQAESKGFQFHWIEYARIASKVVLNTMAATLNATMATITPHPHTFQSPT